jgi:gamma-glutamyltranspeptidase/glutathione hydrolase
LQVLKLLEGFDLKAMGFGSPEYAHALVEAMKLAWEDRATYYGDPAVAPPPLERLLSSEYAEERRRLIDPAAARNTHGAVPKETHTTYLTVADRDGMIVPLISSLFDGFGSGLVPEDCGFALQSRAAGFALVPEHPNVYAPSKSPVHTIITGVVTKDGAPWFSFGVLGGSFQPQGHVQVLVNLIDFGMNVQEAGDAPRISISGGPEPWDPQAAKPFRVHLETGVAQQTFDGLARRDPATGVYEAGTEMRMDGMAGGH